VSGPRAERLARLERRCGSDLERRFLRHLDSRGLGLPSRAQVFIEACRTRPDFLYDQHQTAVYVDGPHHDHPERRTRDAAQSDCMEDHGYTVLRFGHQDDWDAEIARNPGVFGRPR
jgi:very-short-patch-repair endonuclease